MGEFASNDPKALPKAPPLSGRTTGGGTFFCGFPYAIEHCLQNLALNLDISSKSKAYLSKGAKNIENAISGSALSVLTLSYLSK